MSNSNSNSEVIYLDKSDIDSFYVDEDSKIALNLDPSYINVNNNLGNTQLQEYSQINQFKGLDTDSFSPSSLDSVFLMGNPLEPKMIKLSKNILYDIQNKFVQETISNEDNQQDDQIYFINNRIPDNKNNNNTQKNIPNLTPIQIENNEPIVYDYFLKACNNNKKMTYYSIARHLNTKFREHLKNYSIPNKDNNLNELTPENYIQLVLINSGKVYNQNIGLNVYRIFLSCVGENEKLNKEENKKENKEPSNFNNIKTNTIGILPEKNDLDKKNFININVNKNKRKRTDSTKFEVQEEKPTAEIQK